MNYMGPDGSTSIKGDDDIELLGVNVHLHNSISAILKTMIPVVVFIGTVILVSMSKLSK